MNARVVLVLLLALALVAPSYGQNRRRRPTAPTDPAASAPAATAPVSGWQIRETSLGRLPRNAIREKGALVVSPDASRVAYIVSEGGKQRVVVDGAAQEPFARVIFPMTFSPDGKRLGYAAVNGSGENAKAFFVIDGRASAPFDELRVTETRKAVFFSSDSRRVAYIGVKLRPGQDDHSVVVVDGVPGKPHAGGMTKAGLVWSPDSRRWAVCMMKANGKVVVVTDDAAGPEYDSVATRAHGDVDFRTNEVVKAGGQLGTFAFSPDGQRFAYAAKRGTTDVVVLDGKEVATHERLRQGGAKVEFEVGGVNGPLVRNDGRLLYFLTDFNRKNACVVVDGKRQKEYRALDSGGGFSPDGKRYAYFGKPSAKERIVVLDGLEGKIYGAADSRPDDLVFSPDSAHLAARVHKDGKQLILLDGKEGKPYTQLFGFTFSPDGKRYAYAAQDGQRGVLVVDGQEFGPHADFHVSGPSFSPDSRHVGLFAKARDGWRLVLDGVRLEVRWSLPLSRLVFTSPTAARAIVARGEELFRLDVTLRGVGNRATAVREDHLQGDDFYPPHRRVASFLGGQLHGEAKGYAKDGKLIYREQYEDGLLHGERICWRPGGQKHSVMGFRQGKRHGQITVWFENGKVAFSAGFKDGQPHGTNTIYYKTGKKMQEVNYRDGRGHGVTRSYQPDGKVWLEGSSANGQTVRENVIIDVPPEVIKKRIEENSAGTLREIWAAAADRPGRDPVTTPPPPVAARKLTMREAAVLPAFIENDSSYLTITPDSRRALLHAKGTSIVWDLTTRQEIHRSDRLTNSYARLNADGRTLLMCDPYKTNELYAFDLASKTKGRVPLVKTWNGRLTYAPDGKTLAVALTSPGVEGQILVLLDAAGFTEKAALTGFDARVDDVAFTPDGKTLLAILNDRDSRRIVKLDPGTLAERGALEAKLDKYDYNAYLLVSPDGKLAGAHHQKDKPIAVCDLATGKLRATLAVKTTNNYHSGFAADRSVLIHGTASNLTFWDLRTGAARHQLDLTKALGYVIFRGVAISADGRWLAAGSPKGEIVVWDIPAMKEAVRVKAHLGEIYSLAFTPDCRTLLSVGEEQKLKSWTLAGE